MAVVAAMLFYAATALAQPGNPGSRAGGNGEQPPAKQAEPQRGIMGGQQGMGGMAIT